MAGGAAVGVDDAYEHRVGGDVDELDRQAAVLQVFDLRPAAIIRDLDLLRPIYAATAAYGHFGRTDLDLPWERTDRADVLKAAANA